MENSVTKWKRNHLFQRNSRQTSDLYADLYQICRCQCPISGIFGEEVSRRRPVAAPAKSVGGWQFSVGSTPPLEYTRKNLHKGSNKGELLFGVGLPPPPPLSHLWRWRRRHCCARRGHTETAGVQSSTVIHHSDSQPWTVMQGVARKCFGTRNPERH